MSNLQTLETLENAFAAPAATATPDDAPAPATTADAASAAPAMLTVTIGTPGNMQRVTLTGGGSATVQDALTEAKINAAGQQFRSGGTFVSLDSPVTDGQTILVLRNLRGN